MSVYVDATFEAESKNPQAARWGTRWSHMFADSADELHAMAARIGLKRAYAQHDGGPLWRLHYDLIPSKRALAVRLGAHVLTRDEHVDWMRRKREAGE